MEYQKYSYKPVTIDLTSAVTNFPVEVEGQIITHISGDVSVNIRLDHRTQDPIPLGPRDSITFPAGFTFQRFFVSGSAGGGTVVLHVSKPLIKVDKGQVYVAGNISIGRDKSWHYNSDQEIAFVNRWAVVPVAGESPICMLWNPASSGILVKVKKITVVSATADTMRIGRYNSIAGFTQRTQGYNCYLTKTAGAAYIYTDTNAAPIGIDYMKTIYVPAATTVESKFSNAIVIPESQGLFVEADSQVNFLLTATFEYIEE